MKEETKKHATKCPLNGYIDEAMVRAPDCTCDSYHTFEELYNHRITLYIALCSQIAQELENSEYAETKKVWRSKRHSDRELAFGGSWFVLGINKKMGHQITYHLPIEKWNETGFAETLDKAPEFDGHTSDDVISRLKLLTNKSI